jgi:hypothetical protein
MKKIFICLTSLFLFSLTACKKKKSESEAVQKINSLVSEEKISKQIFTNELLPLVNDLYEHDSLKYRIIHHIALKAEKEKRKDIFEAQVKNLKAEMKFIK